MTIAKPGLWAPGNADAVPILAILLIPFLIIFPELFGFFHGNPMLIDGALATGVRWGSQRGVAYIDPNDGFTVQALGRLAITLWLHGVVPWWNSYSGVGMPLAGEFQPAAFSPVNLLLLLPHGVILRHLMMQYIAGVGMYCFIRQIGWSPLAAATGGLLFAQNGSLAWLAHAPPDPGCLLPWMLLGIERAAIASTLNASARTGWRLTGLATGAMALTGFPETAYICGLFAALYSVWRLLQCRFYAWAGMIWRVALGGAIGLALAAPQLLAFAEFLQRSAVGGHDGQFGQVGLPPQSFIMALLAPYAYGPIFAFNLAWLSTIWSNIGGYCDLLMLTLAAAALAVRRDSLPWILFGWVIACTLKTFAIQPVTDLWNLLPGMRNVAFFRYAPSSVEFAIILLACCAIEALRKPCTRNRLPVVAAAITGLAGIFICYSNLPHLRAIVTGQPDVLKWTTLSYLWMTLSAMLAVLLIGFTKPPRRAEWLAALLVLDATAMFLIPTLSTPRGGSIDRQAVAFLHGHLGLQRFYTLGPIGPNYGAYFQTASINHNYLPVPLLWTDYIKAHLDPNANPILFIGLDFNPSPPDALTEFKLHQAAFAQIGVKYLVTPASVTAVPGIAPVYHDPLLSIFELPDPAPYFETGNRCVLQPESRSVVIADCADPTSLLRREMYFPGWQATVAGKSVPIAEASELFQSIALPAGRSRVEFSFSPPHVFWAWCAFWAALLLLGASWIATALRRLMPPAASPTHVAPPR